MKRVYIRSLSVDGVSFELDDVIFVIECNGRKVLGAVWTDFLGASPDHHWIVQQMPWNAFSSFQEMWSEICILLSDGTIELPPEWLEKNFLLVQTLFSSVRDTNASV